MSSGVKEILSILFEIAKMIIGDRLEDAEEHARRLTLRIAVERSYRRDPPV